MMPRTQFVLLESGGHLSPRVLPDLYNKALMGFLDE